MTLSPGIKLGSYEIIALLGSGGMGDVYRARDPRLGREVAVKTIAPQLASEPDALARFQREARAIAALSDPNILAIHDIGEHEGVWFLVTELFERPCARDRAPRPQAGEPVRDPERARQDPRLRTRPAGSCHGERERHGFADAVLSDRVLHEMLAGKRPFHGDSPAETIAAILKDTPSSPWARGAPIPAGLDRIVIHCLEKNRDERFESARDLAFALKAVSGGAATAVAVEGARSGPPSVAVLPFLNLSEDPENEFFTDGVTEDVIAHLSKIRSLKVISRTSVMLFKKSERSMREIGATLGAATILEGSVRRSGNRVRIVAQLIDARTDEHLWTDTYDRERGRGLLRCGTGGGFRQSQGSDREGAGARRRARRRAWRRRPARLRV